MFFFYFALVLVAEQRVGLRRTSSKNKTRTSSFISCRSHFISRSVPCAAGPKSHNRCTNESPQRQSNGIRCVLDLIKDAFNVIILISWFRYHLRPDAACAHASTPCYGETSRSRACESPAMCVKTRFSCKNYSRPLSSHAAKAIRWFVSIIRDVFVSWRSQFLNVFILICRTIF